MQINPKDLLPIKELLKESGLPIAEGQVEKIVDTLNKLLQYNDELEKQSEAELGPEKWAKVKAEREETIAKFSNDFAVKLQKILGSMEPTDKL
jgi:Asp-tRNA(Asn)/Glu-tRNA(Gln) amidotransferase C subunit